MQASPLLGDSYWDTKWCCSRANTCMLAEGHCPSGSPLSPPLSPNWEPLFAAWRLQLNSNNSLSVGKNMESIHGVDVGWLHHPRKGIKGECADVEGF